MDSSRPEDIGKIKALWKRLSAPVYRAQFLHSRIRSSLAAQIYFIRESRRWTQSDLAERAGTKQPAISRIEKGEGALSLKTLEALAKAFDVGLEIRFVPHSAILEDAVYGRIERFVPPYEGDIPDALALVNSGWGSIPRARYSTSYEPLRASKAAQIP